MAKPKGEKNRFRQANHPRSKVRIAQKKRRLKEKEIFDAKTAEGNSTKGNNSFIKKQKVYSCSAFGCTEQSKIGSNIAFFKFPREKIRRDLWIKAVKQGNWSPPLTSVLCSKHFQTGKPSKSPTHPDYIPNIFVVTDTVAKLQSHASIVKTNESQCLIKIEDMPKPSSSVTSISKGSPSKDSGYPAADSDLFACINSVEKHKNHSSTARAEEAESVIHDEIEIENTPELSSSSNYVNEVAEKEKELQEAYKEIIALRSEKIALQNYITGRITDRIFQDVSKLHFFTGLNSTKDFHLLTKYLHDVDMTSTSISVSSQLLIVLMRLQLNLKYPDLADRFQTSINTIKMICESVIPHLESKLKLLLEGLSPITVGIKSNVSQCYTNTVFEKLYKTIQSYNKTAL